MKAVEKFANIIRKVLFRLYSIAPINDKMIFTSFNGKQYSDNPRAICEYIHKLLPQYELVWYIVDEVSVDIIPSYIRVVKGRWLTFLRELATSKVYVTNTQISSKIFKRKGQLFIQTWHANCGFKKGLLQVDPKFDIKDDQYTDLCLSGSSFSSWIYRDAFGYHGRILEGGTPRNDKLLSANNSLVNDIKKKIGLNENTKVLLYAPTFRDSFMEKGHIENTKVDLPSILLELEKNDEKWICIIRKHVNSVGIKYHNNDNIIDLSNYPDMADLLLISDFLITDYSSSACDFVLTGKPVILAAFDEKQYSTEDRQLYCPLKKTGFCVVHNQGELNKIVNNYQDINFEKFRDQVIAHFGINETGSATKNVCEEIIRSI